MRRLRHCRGGLGERDARARRARGAHDCNAGSGGLLHDRQANIAQPEHQQAHVRHGQAPRNYEMNRLLSDLRRGNV